MNPIYFKVYDGSSSLAVYDNLMCAEWSAGVQPRWVEDGDTLAPEGATHYVQHPYDDDFLPGHTMVLLTLFKHPLVERVWYGNPLRRVRLYDVPDIVEKCLYGDWSAG